MKPLWQQYPFPIRCLSTAYNNVVHFVKKIAHELRDWRNWVVFTVVYLAMTVPAWIGWILYFITRNSWHLMYSTAYIAFWALPCTPLLGLCFAITFAIRRFFMKKKPHGRIRSG